ncbi:DegT/DnrJ/EryC1/StrS aminotransferase family protein [Clostridium botulinum]|uniref:DegT/DnrJ/EryC1/StrS family aminotransferase n=1 Tax=Clostridium botulinum TaxID=1491 RepID=UPI001A939958|nr:DegT/DnrJ/EryC1/StrS aminotransferase family protein [Clostridium botulinum]MBO0525475.1 DegT/DnrJ/EryC1/StrS aminotransferase family protein [Clostridium botulinum]MBO0526924.1 DegT/DnrJ/EryC1/StrS aminotransferase family protein [Clostridium botulinum]MBO0537893.1 DegT/DnrJ/EryC1/StrS aminotransferase family protein [Clostridium botulinum]MBO0546442.1 DegT/DnrJ/EryC1/StrS aminotransferase family protein [Clostridium botulinum]MBO0557989.1 DegT/DnrJ/EryC1/StrS aminotransferase family prote
MKKIPFSPPDITEREIDAVVEVLKSGWITSGPKTQQFENNLAEYCHTNKAVAVSSASAGLELVLKEFDIKEGDEVITTPYTYTATASVCLHRGIKPKFVDVAKDSFLIDIEKLADAITPKTKAIYTVDFAGVPVDYDAIKEVLKAKGREDIILVSDSAHSLGAIYKGKKVGGQVDFHVFSFHAVKNLTTAEGGAITFGDNNFKGKEDLHKDFKLQSLHGQSKDALSKTKAGAWEYDILTDGHKCNMTDMGSAIGLVQLTRYEEMLRKREAIFDTYTKVLQEKDWAIIPFKKDETKETSYHLYPLRIKGFGEVERNEVIKILAEKDIATNVHFKPLPMFTLYKNLGYNIEDYPNAYAQYANEISLPVYSTLSLEDAEYVAKELVAAVEKVMK